MASDAWSNKIEAYADGELSGSEIHGMAEHLRTCASCTSDLLGRVQMKRAIKTAGSQFHPSVAFKQKIQAGLAPTKSRGRRWNWVPALAGAAALALVLVVFVQRTSTLQQGQMVAELVDLHVATLASSTPVDVVSTDRHTVKPWFEGKIPFSFNLPELGTTPYTLEGGRMSYLDQAPGAQLIFKSGKHRISVFIFQNRPGMHFPAADNRSMRLTFNVESWTAVGLSYFVIGDAEPTDIHNLSELLKAAAGS